MAELQINAGAGAFGVNNLSMGGSPVTFVTPFGQILTLNAAGDTVTASGAVVTLGIVEGASGHHDIQRGWELTQVSVVRGLNAGGTLDTFGLGHAAIEAVASITGGRGAAGPLQPAGSDNTPWLSGNAAALIPTYIVGFAFEPMGAFAAKVRTTYHGFPLPVFEFGGGLNEYQTNIAVGGTPITVSYDYPADYALNIRLQGTTQTQGVMLSRPVPEPCFTLRLIVTSGLIGNAVVNASEMMSYYKFAFEGKINSNVYGMGFLMGVPHTWLCEQVHGTSHDGGQTYEASLTFHYKPNGWDPMATYINPDTGQPPPDLVAGTGYKVYQVIPDAVLPTFTFAPN